MAARICSRSLPEIGGSVLTGFTLAAGVTATGIRGALGTSAAAAKEANASDPLGVEILVFVVVELGRVVVLLAVIVGVVFTVVLLDGAVVLVVVRTVVLVFVEVFIAGGGVLLAQKPPDDLFERN